MSVEMTMIIYRHCQRLAIERVGAQDAQLGIDWSVFSRALKCHPFRLPETRSQSCRFALLPRLNDCFGCSSGCLRYVIGVQLPYPSDECRAGSVVTVRAIHANCVCRYAGFGCDALPNLAC